MGAPTQPTVATIVAEAYASFGLSNPTAAQTTRAQGEGIEKVKRDIWLLGKKWKTLRTIQYLTLVAGTSRYANPSDFEQSLQEPAMSLLDGTSRGTLQAGGASSVTLAATEGVSAAGALGRLLMFTSGTGINQAEQIISYNAGTKVATLRAALTTAPIAGDGYLIVNTHYPVTSKSWPRRGQILQPAFGSKPGEAYEMGAGPAGYIELYPNPDQTYGLKRDYYANLLLVDTGSTLYNQILRNWAGVFTQGIKAGIEAEYDDSRRGFEEQIYTNLLKLLMARELDFMNDSNLQAQVSD